LAKKGIYGAGHVRGSHDGAMGKAARKERRGRSTSALAGAAAAPPAAIAVERITRSA
jgi:hypothetical protein